MRWFRDNVRQGSWAALVALAINLALSFGHVHAIDGRGLGHPAGVLAAFVSADDSDHGPGQPDQGHADYLCPICLASTAIASAIAPTPPVLPVEFVVGTIDQPIECAVALVEPQHPPFQSRGPPIS
ncbi:MAG TPA: hypothetical protein VMM15_17870 [Bradyrhizobium sp.]|nr:hypothetical protein [Bradyrhizobium sp.]